MPEKKTLPLATLTQDQRTKLGATLIDHAHDLRADEEQITEEEGFDLVTALDTLGEELRAPARPRKIYLSFDEGECAQVFRDEAGTVIGQLHENDGAWIPEHFRFLADHLGVEIVEVAPTAAPEDAVEEDEDEA